MKRSKKKEIKNKKSKGSSKTGLIIKITLILAASLLICATTYGIYLTKQAELAAGKAYEELAGRDVPKLRETKVEPIKDNISILFVGIDDSETRGQGENARSDALILATLNNKTKTVKMVSIPRDSYVYIPYVGYQDKITHAHAYGGTLASIETVEELFQIPIDYYVRMNFDAFIDVVDALDGIEVEVPYALNGEKDELDRNSIYLKPGLQTLNGSQALALARTRKQDNDIERGLRQQEILKAITSKAASVTSFTKYDDILKAVGDNMKTDMTFDEMKSLFAYIKAGVPRVDTLKLVGYDDMSTGVYYYQLDQASVTEVSETLKAHLGLIPTPTDVTDDSTTSTNLNSNALNNDSSTTTQQ